VWDLKVDLWCFYVLEFQTNEYSPVNFHVCFEMLCKFWCCE
jgi:hypothetical protein